MTLHSSLYELAGGEPTFRLLVQRFYARVATDPILRRVYPEEDLSGATERLALFLIQYWGGPSTYSDQRGHPRLRMRHAPFAIGQPERDAWLVHMTAAVDSLGLAPQVRQALVDYFETAGLPFIVGINGFHGKFPHTIADVQEALSVNPNVPIVECDARSRASTKATLIALVEHAMAVQMSVH